MNAINHQTHRVMHVNEITKAKWDELRQHAFRKLRDSFIFPMLYNEGTEEDKNDPNLYMIAFRYKARYYVGHWPYSLEEFHGIDVDSGVETINQVYYRKPQLPEAA